ncbi:unnamed protein product [Danaus chrysippus]|uniref:(African queen) hypothetical protein n=1 Tax=Danaus chrysippus TaxID=151541 RepID=A0A8J2VZC6_9NEOP|nr:unnamed protein product [Danaus chrysippus]
MENDDRDEEQPSTSKKESQRNNSTGDMYVDSHDDDGAHSEMSMPSSATYSFISKLDMAATGPDLPKSPLPKTDNKIHQKRKREKNKRIVGRVEKKRRPLTKRQAIRKAPKRKQKPADEKKDRVSMSTIFTRLSSNSQTPRLSIQAGSCSKFLSPLFVATNSSLADNQDLSMSYSEITPDMLHEALRKLTMWKQDVQTTAILDYLITNYPVNKDKEDLVIELLEKLKIASLLGIVCRTSENTWSLTHEFQKRLVSKNHVTLFWKMYVDTLRPITARQVDEPPNPSKEDKATTTKRGVITIYDEDVL